MATLVVAGWDGESMGDANRSGGEWRKLPDDYQEGERILAENLAADKRAFRALPASYFTPWRPRRL